MNPYDTPLNQLVSEEEELEEYLKTLDEEDPQWDITWKQIQAIRKEQEKQIFK